MANKKPINCYSCGACNLPKNDVGLNKKLLGEGIDRFMCLECLASYLEVTTDELLAKIEEFKAEGCKLFG